MGYTRCSGCGGLNYSDIHCNGCGHVMKEEEKPDRQWVSFKEKLPEIGEWVLVYTPCEFNYKKFHVGYLNEALFFEIGADPDDYGLECASYAVTHWMPLPKVPHE